MTDSPIPPTAPAPLTGTALPDSRCPLCRTWSAYCRDGRGSGMAPAFREHSFLVAGYWLGLKGSELGPLCEAHKGNVAAVEEANEGAAPAAAFTPPAGDPS
ncbi:MAG: hypothetical protein ACHQC8_06495 [Solirubrobacterales bacterium]